MQLFRNAASAGVDIARAEAMIEGRLAGGTDPPSITGFLLDQLRTYAELRGDTAAALSRASAHLALVQRTNGSTSPLQCFPLWRSIPLLLDSDRRDDALTAAQRCLDLTASQGAKSVTHASALNNLGYVYYRNGSITAAADAFEKALRVLEQTDLSTAALLSTAMVESTRQPAILNVRANLGLAHWKQGDLARVAAQFEAARVLMTRDSDGWVTERNAVEYLARIEAEIDALLSVERESAARGIAPHPVLALPLILERKGLALEDKASTVRVFGRKPDDLREYRTLLAMRARLARGTPNAGSDATQQGFASETEFQIQTLEYKARNQARADRMMAATAMDPADAKEFQKYTLELVKETGKLLDKYSKSKSKNDAQSDMSVHMRAEAEARAKVDPRYKRLLAKRESPLRSVREELLAGIQARIPESAALIEMVHYRPMTIAATTAADRWLPARYGAYVVKRSGGPVFVDLGDAATIDANVVEFRRSLAQPRGTLAHDLGRRLDQSLMQPLRAQTGAASMLYLSPDGVLNLLPFAALVDEQDQYLIERFTFTYVSSGRDLLRAAAPAGNSAANPVVVVGDPAFDGSVADAASVEASGTRGLADQRFDRLPGTAAEARAIGTLLGKSTVLTGVDATETAIKSVTSPRVLHIATHGFFLADQDWSLDSSSSAAAEDPMLRSGLAFAGVNVGRSGNDDGVLTALEAAGLNLAGTQLVVLSACETGVGEIKTGEGVFGLRRAFTVAGSESLVMSLWQVEDNATQQLMTEFYRRLARGDGRAEALRQAGLSLLREPEHRHPFYWASFIVSGDAGPLHR